MMIRDRLITVTWELMLGTLYLGVRGMDSGSGLLVMAPWISDLENRSHRLPMPLRDEVVAESGRNLDRFSEIVATMRRHDVQVRIMTAPLNSTFKRDWNEASRKREQAFIRRLVDAGAEIRYHPESHEIDFISLAALSGSANVTDNAFYRNEEQMTLQGEHKALPTVASPRRLGLKADPQCVGKPSAFIVMGKRSLG